MLLLAVLLEISHVFLLKMELAAVCRETAILRSRIRQPGAGNALQDLRLTNYANSARWAAAHTGALDPRLLEYSEKTFIFPGLPATGDTSISAGSRWMANAAGGTKITLRYRLPDRGLRRVVFPGGLVLEESLSVKSGFYKHPVQKITESFLSGP